MPHTPRVSVLMPTFEQSHFIQRALCSLRAQTLEDWEAVIVDDGSEDATFDTVAPMLADPRIRYLRLPQNEGLGRALNVALDAGSAPLVAYLPSDDVYYPPHLERLAAQLEKEREAVLAYSGLRHHYNRSAPGAPEAWLQLVQCMHRRVDMRWIERLELETDDLERLFWSRLRLLGPFVGNGELSCEWVDHPDQRHKLMQEPTGGINRFRQHYRVAAPLRYHASTGNVIDEESLYRRFRERPATPPRAEGLRILLAGELAYNAERVLALEEQGHTLYGLWMRDPYWFNSIGPLPFGHVRDLPRRDWRAAVRELRPDIIYAQLNWQAVPFVHEVMLATRGIPFVWHFKEGPFICLEKGLWRELLDLYRQADGQIYASHEMRDWFETVVPGLARSTPSMVLDGDLPKREWFDGAPSPRLSEADGEIHTVVPGRPIGLHPHTVAELAAHGIHLHFYGDFTQGQWRGWIDKSRERAPRHLHLHANVAQDRWIEEFSRFDAGWLHCFASRNGGELARADWDDLNIPARVSTLAMAGLPMIQRANPGAIVATQALTRQLGIGLFHDDIGDLAARLADREAMRRLREQVWHRRAQFCFDTHVPALVGFFREVIAGRNASRDDGFGRPRLS